MSDRMAYIFSCTLHNGKKINNLVLVYLTVVENFDRSPFEDALFFKESIVRPWSAENSGSLSILVHLPWP